MALGPQTLLDRSPPCCKVGFGRVWPSRAALLQGEGLPSHPGRGSGLYQGIWEPLLVPQGPEYILTPKHWDTRVLLCPQWTLPWLRLGTLAWHFLTLRLWGIKVSGYLWSM